MTNRTERIAVDLINTFDHRMPMAMERGWYADRAAEILAIAQPSRYMTIGDVARQINRNKTTVLSWISRGKHDVPAPLGRTINGSIWDGDDIDEWADAHPELHGSE